MNIKVVALIIVLLELSNSGVFFVYIFYFDVNAT
jgi:hypothetical protein